jgi:hypothetical protein
MGEVLNFVRDTFGFGTAIPKLGSDDFASTMPCQAGVPDAYGLG